MCVGFFSSSLIDISSINADIELDERERVGHVSEREL